MPRFAGNSTAANSTAAKSTVANITLAVSTNTSTFEASRFPFIIPYDQTQACDIYGTLGQTGSITVGVNLTSRTSTTVLPCSSYLTAQSSFLEAAAALDGSNGFQNVLPDEWQANFGRSPECKSYAQAFDRGQWTRSYYGSSQTSIYSIASDGLYPVQIPPGVNQFDSPDQYFTCCGNCSVKISEVKLYYFPDDTTTKCHSNQTSNSTSVLSTGNRWKRMQSLVGDGSVAVVDGHTLYARPSESLRL